jgi:hypothetical protein
MWQGSKEQGLRYRHILSGLAGRKSMIVLAYIHIGEVVVGEAAEKGGCVHDADYVESHAFIDR